jgi:hypothetical protein
MQILGKIRSFAFVICSIVTLASAAPVFAQHGGVVVVHGGGYYGGYRVGYYGGYRGYYGYPGWYGGYYWGGYGLALATLPYYYSNYWYGGVPYYTNNAYFVAGPAVGQYRTASAPLGGQAPSELYVYPISDQSPYQQSVDKYECYRWAVSQLGYDPTSAGGGTVRRDLTDYNRAQIACLAARGYSVK